MRFKLFLSRNTEIIPYDYYYKLAGLFHSWIGPNNLHDLLSLYNIGSLYSSEVKASRNGLDFHSGAQWTIGIYNQEIAEQLISGLLLESFDFYGMSIQRVEKIAPPIFLQNRHYYWASSPILTRWIRQDDTREHLIYNDPRTTLSLTKTLKHKVDEAGLDEYWDSQTHIAFDVSYPKAKTRLIRVKNLDNKANVCPVIIQAHEKIQYLCWEIGVGESTGIGFGSLNYGWRLD